MTQLVKTLIAIIAALLCLWLVIALAGCFTKYSSTPWMGSLPNLGMGLDSKVLSGSIPFSFIDQVDAREYCRGWGSSPDSLVSTFSEKN